MYNVWIINIIYDTVYYVVVNTHMRYSHKQRKHALDQSTYYVYRIFFFISHTFHTVRKEGGKLCRANADFQMVLPLKKCQI